MKAGDRVLIHAAAGGVGLAAVQLAQRAGAEIFATAGSLEKRRHLQMLGVTHVFDSRSLDFANEIMSQTGGRGMDIVLNSLAGKFIAKSVSALAPGGRFLELGKRGILTREQFGAGAPRLRILCLRSGRGSPCGFVSYCPACTRNYSLRSQKENCARFRSPLSRTSVSLKLFVSWRRQNILEKSSSQNRLRTLPAQTSPTKLRLRDDATYLITGGLGGLGLETARWMAGEGAGNIVLMGRHDARYESDGRAQ